MLLTVLAVRAFDAWRAPELSLWQTEVPPELDARQIDAADWTAWLAAEDTAFTAVLHDITGKLPANDRHAANRFFTGSPLYSPAFAIDWNRSYVLMPDGAPRGAVVLLHGLTDSPYSLRHIAALYRERGFVAVGIRMPGHGTAPAALTRVCWEDWLAAARLAVRHARSLTGGDQPLHVVGYSNGGALALKITLDTLGDPELGRVDQLVLISPMIGITSMARFAGVLGWPAVFPPFAKAAWLDTLPEYNPFKYNSFPVNGARQSSQLVRAVEKQLDRALRRGRLGDLPPVLTFQSAVDSTVSSRAVIDTLYARLPDGGHELVLFDRNWQSPAGALLRPQFSDPLTQVVPEGPHDFALSVVTNAAHVPAGAVRVEPADDFPPGMYSLSHVALPFPPDDAVYGYLPSAEDFGVRLGTVAARGERGMLVVGAETLMRASSNPFFDLLRERIAARIPGEVSTDAALR